MIHYLELNDYFEDEYSFSEEILYSTLKEDLRTSFLLPIESVDVRGGEYSVLSLSSSNRNLIIKLEGKKELINLFEVYLRFVDRPFENKKESKVKFIRKDGLGNIEEL